MVSQHLPPNFDPSGVAVHNGNYFGLPYRPEEADILLLPCPWDVTTSYRDGTCRGPAAMLEASYQLDLFSPLKPNAWNTKIGSLKEQDSWLRNNTRLRQAAKQVIQLLEAGKDESNPEIAALLKQINTESAVFHLELEHLVRDFLKNKKKVILVGGDHSVPFGSIKAHAELYPSLSVLHFDAHADLRNAYEGFEHSHASIMRNVCERTSIKNLVQVGIRDVCQDEIDYIKANARIKTFFDWDLYESTALGVSWKEQCQRILSHLGDTVYVSIDIDGLDPKFCPNTGTPVPGGIEFWQLSFLLQELVKSNRKIVGADLVEVSPGENESEWDANVGARLLYQICQLISV